MGAEAISVGSEIGTRTKKSPQETGVPVGFKYTENDVPSTIEGLRGIEVKSETPFLVILNKKHKFKANYLRVEDPEPLDIEMIKGMEGVKKVAYWGNEILPEITGIIPRKKGSFDIVGYRVTETARKLFTKKQITEVIDLKTQEMIRKWVDPKDVYMGLNRGEQRHYINLNSVRVKGLGKNAAVELTY